MDVEKALVCKLIQAAHNLGFDSLYSLGCKTVADLAKTMTPEQIRSEFSTTEYELFY